MVAIFAALIGLIIFMRRNDEKEEFRGSMKAAANAAKAAQKAARDAQNAAKARAAKAAKAAKDAMKRFR